MNKHLQNIHAAARRVAAGLGRALQPTPARVHNLSVLAGVALASVGAGEACGRPAGLITAGALVLAFTALERILLFLRSRD